MVPEGLTPLQREQFVYEQELDADTLVARVLSTSYIAAQPEDARGKVADDVRRLVAGFPPRFVLPYRTDVWWCRRR